MKKIITLIIIGLFLYSCNNQPVQKNSTATNVPDTSGYYAARCMKGIASFRLGETTYKQAINNIKEEIRKDSRKSEETHYKEFPKYQGYDPKFLDFKYDKYGNIVSQFYREDFGYIIKEIKCDTLKSNLKKDALDDDIFGCPKTKAIKIFQYYIGDIELMNFELRFYNDTLYKISCDHEDKLDAGLKEKYGIGKSIKKNEWQTPLGIKSEAPQNEALKKKSKILKIDETTVWENQSIIATSITYMKFFYKDGSDDFSNAINSSYFKMELKNKALIEVIDNCENQASKAKQRLESENKKKELDLL